MNKSTLETTRHQIGEVMLFNGPGLQLELESFPVPELQPGEILVENLYTTICGSDIHTFCGVRSETCPTVLGHEIVGRIVKIHAEHPGIDLRDKPIVAGDRLTWTVFSSDPNSKNSIAGIPQKGDGLFKYGHALAKAPDVFHGGLSQLCILKANTGILKVDDQLPLPVAATINCSVSTVAGALRLAENLKDKRVLITGVGHLGITCASMCKDAGAKWIAAADLSATRLELSRKFGVDETFDLSYGVEAMMQTAKFDVTIDMSGSPEAMELGLNILNIGGIAIWVGAVFKTPLVKINPEAIIRSMISIKGLHNYNLTDFCYALEFMERNWKKYPFFQMIEKEFYFTEAQQAFEYAVEKKPLRVGLKIANKN